LNKETAKRLTKPTVIVLLIVAVTFFPWKAPSYDAQLAGFDANFLYSDPRGSGSSAGSIEILPDRLTINTVPGSNPLVDVTSSESSYQVQFDLTVPPSSSVVPVRLSIFFPLANENVTVDFQGLSSSIMGYVLQRGVLTPYDSELLGSYTPGEPFHVTVDIERGAFILISVSKGGAKTYTATSSIVPSLLAADRRVLQIASLSGGEAFSVVLENLVVSVPHDTFFAPRSNDSALVPVYSLVAIAILFLYRERFRGLFTSSLSVLTKIRRMPRPLLLLVLASLAVQLAVTPLANHPHDIFSEKIWIYSLMQGGLGDLYFRPLVTVVAEAFGGVPNQHAVYPYPPLLGYFYYAAAVPLAAAGITSVENFAFEFLAKTINIFGNLVSGILVYLLALELSPSRKKSIVAAGAYLLNPALIFDAAVWSETDPILIMFLLGAMLFLLRKRTGLVWVCLGLALLTKQTAIVPAGLIALVSIRYAGIQSNFRGLAIGLSVAFLTILPYVFVGYSPFVMLSQTILRISHFAAGSNALPTSSPISADAFSFLPLISPLNGLVGRERMWYPDVNLVPLIGLSYGTFGKLLFGISVVPVAWIGLRRVSFARSDLAIMLVAFITLLSDFLPTRVSGRYFLIPVALLAPVAFVSDRRSIRFSFWVLTATTFVSMYYLIAGWSVWVPSALPNFNHAQLVEAWFSLSYAVDRLIDLAILLNLLGILMLGRVLIESWRRHEKGSDLSTPVTVA